MSKTVIYKGHIIPLFFISEGNTPEAAYLKFDLLFVMNVQYLLYDGLPTPAVSYFCFSAELP